MQEPMPTAVVGLITLPSNFGPVETMERLVSTVTTRGMAVLARIDHAAAAEKVGLQLRSTQVLIFGNAKAGTPLMQAVQTIGIDLPLRALVWQDEAGRTWLSYNEPAWLAERHGVASEAGKTLEAMAKALADSAREAVRDSAETRAQAAAPEPSSTQNRKHQEDLLDEALEESFPASDPPAIPSAR